MLTNVFFVFQHEKQIVEFVNNEEIQTSFLFHVASDNIMSFLCFISELN